jgi:hypothetical protein
MLWKFLKAVTSYAIFNNENIIQIHKSYRTYVGFKLWSHSLKTFEPILEFWRNYSFSCLLWNPRIPYLSLCTTYMFGKQSMLDILTFTYATGGMSDLRPVNMVTSVSMDVTSRVTRPGIASRPIQKLNQDNITTSVLGAKVWIRWCPI